MFLHKILTCRLCTTFNACKCMGIQAPEAKKVEHVTHKFLMEIIKAHRLVCQHSYKCRGDLNRCCTFV